MSLAVRTVGGGISPTESPAPKRGHCRHVAEMVAVCAPEIFFEIVNGVFGERAGRSALANDLHTVGSHCRVIWVVPITKGNQNIAFQTVDRFFPR